MITVSNIERVCDNKVVLPNFSKQSNIIVRANGDAMNPTLKDGDMLSIREVNPFGNIFYGNIFVVITQDYKMVKRVKRYPQDEKNYVILHSDNPEYDDILFSRSKIMKLYVVESVLSISRMTI